MNVENSRDYYGQVLQGSADLKTDACCTLEPPSPPILAAMANVHPDVKSRYYGCGLIAPEAVEGMRILDLGSGSGQDAYVLAQLAGAEGCVVGVDATREQLDVAREHLDWHAERFGYRNVVFVEGDIERLDTLDLEPASFDLVVSNCVLNLVADKARVFRDVYALLKPGGEFHFSDVYADRRVPRELMDDSVLHGECLSGALYWGDFDALAKAAGFLDPRLVADRQLGIGDPEVAAKVEGIRFFSATYRLFKVDQLEPRCEDYGQAVRYKGTIPGHEHAFMLDRHHLIERGRMFAVCGNSWRMLAETRFAGHFEFFGDFSTHYGIFPACGELMPFGTEVSGANVSGCC